MRIVQSLLLAGILCLAAQSGRAEVKLRMKEGYRVESHLNGQTVSFTDFLDAMVAVKNPTFFRNIKIVFDLSEDKKGMDTRWANGGPRLHVRHDVFLYDCEFDREFWLVARDLTFHGLFSFYNCKNLKGVFKGCEFRNSVRCFGNEFEFMDFEDCQFRHGFKWGRGFMMDHLKFSHCQFSVDPELLPNSYGPDMEGRTLLVNNKLEEFDLTLDHCVFKVPDSLAAHSQYFATMNHTQFSNLRIMHCDFHTGVNITQSSISNLFQSYGCHYRQSVVIDALNLNPVNTKVDWLSLDNYRLAVFHHDSDSLVSGLQPHLLNDPRTVNTLISCYANLYQAFRTQGNRLAANACYVEWKNLETVYLRNLSYTSVEGSPYFLYLMNIFLREFCDYGTNPLKSLLISAYVLLAFAAVYFLYPWQIGEPDRGFYRQMLLFAQYFTRPGRLAQMPAPGGTDWALEGNGSGWQAANSASRDLAAASQGTMADAYKQFVQTQPSKAMPFYFRLIGKYRLRTNLYTRFQQMLLRTIDWLPRQWQHYSPFRRFIYATFYGLLILTLLLSYLFVRVLDATALSLNVFSTLGFGQIPIYGVPRYLTILEGFIGWFLLSIFSVSLISQVIQ
ncbi:MAG: hypothetical protein KF690_05445 [Bacteroidetes bacterium]|nr:hypothetical protein [Bacteroidota bacterium]